ADALRPAERKTHHPGRLQLSHPCRARCRDQRRRDKAPIPPRARDKDKAICPWEFAPGRDQTGAASINPAIPARVRAQSKYSSTRVQTFPSAIFVPAQGYLLNLLSSCGTASNAVRLNLAGGNSPSGCDGKNGYRCPDEVHKSRRIGSIKDCICSQQKTAADIEELVRSRVSFQFLMGNHRVRYKESCCSHPSNRIKPYSIIHTLES